MSARIAFCLILAMPAFPASPVFVRTQPGPPTIEIPKVSRMAGAWSAWVPNLGQNQPEVELSTQHGRQPVWTFLRRDGITTTLYFPDLVERGWVHLNFVDSGAPNAESSGPTGAHNSYYLGNIPSKWLKDVPHFQQVEKRSVWPGVDFRATNFRGHVEYEWRLAPGADPKRIRLEIKDAEAIEIASNGDLVFRVRSGEIRHTAPEAFQRFEGKKRFVPVRFEIEQGLVGFALGAYDRSRELVIDPAIVAQNTPGLLRYSGYSSRAGQLQDFPAAAESFRLAAARWELITQGSTASPNNGWGTFKAVRDIYFDATDITANPSGDFNFDYFGSTVVGGSGDDVPRALDIVVIPGGTAQITGIAQSASGDAPIFDSARAYQGTLSGASDAYGLLLDVASNAVTPRYSTFIGGPVAENATDTDFFTTVDNRRCGVYTLSTRSPNLPTLNPFSANLQGVEDVFFLLGCVDAQNRFQNELVTYLPGNGTEAFPQAEYVSTLTGTPFRDRLWYFVASDSSEIRHTQGLIGRDYLAPGANMRISGYERSETSLNWTAGGNTWVDAGPGVETPSGIKSIRVSNDRWNLSDRWSFNIGFRYEDVGEVTTFNAPLYPGTTTRNPGGPSNYIATVNPEMTRVEAHGFFDGSRSENLQGLDWSPDGLCFDVTQITTSTDHVTTADAPYRTYPGGTGNGIFRRFCRGPDDLYQLHFATYSGFPGDYTPRSVASTEFFSVFTGFGAQGLPIIGGGGQYHGDLDPTEQIIAQFPVFENAMLTGGSFQAINEIGPQSLLTLFSPYPLAEGLTVGGPDDFGIWPESLEGARAFFDGKPVPIIFTSANQMSLFAPRTFAGPTTNFRIEVDGLISNTITFDVGATAPQILTQNASGKGLGAILNQDYTLNTLANPADDNEVIQIFYIPGVDLNPACPDGTLTPLAEPLPRTPLPTIVEVAGNAATSAFSGGAPGALCGAGQANAVVRLPSSVPTGVSEQPLRILYDGRSSQVGVTVAVRK